VVAWIAAEEPGQAMSGLTELAEKLGLRYPGEDASSAVRKARRWLESAAPEDCLVIFDNAVDLDGLRQWLPATGHARIIITSNRHAFGDLGEAIDVDVFTPAEALAFLRTRVGSINEAGAEQLAEEVGRLPLALAQSAGVITQQKLTYDAFITRLRESVDDHLDRGSDPYPLRASQAVLLAVAAAEAADPLARPLLNLLAVLSPEGLDRSLVHAALQDIAAASPTDADRTLGRLSDVSLITLSLEDQRAIMHRFTQRLVRDRARRDGALQTSITSAVRLLRDALIPGERAWVERTAAADLIQQITALWESAKSDLANWNNESLTGDLLMLRLWAVRHLVDVSDPARAMDLGIEVLADHERLLDGEHTETQVCRDRVATAYQYAGRLDRAIPLFKQNLADSERILGPDHPDTLTSRNNLAGAYRDAGRLDEAITLHERTLTDRERILGPDHPDTLTSRNNLAGAYRGGGLLDDAIPLFKQNLADSERILGPDHPDTLTSRNNLAIAYQEAGRLDEAITLHERTLTDRERILGPDHPDTLTSRNNLAGTYQEAGHLDEAITLHERTLTDRERILGPDHPDTLTSRNNLAGTYQEAGHLDEAITLHERTLTDRERILGPDHPDTLTSRNNLARSYQDAGHLNDAIALFEKTLGECERVLSQGHPLIEIVKKDLNNARRERVRKSRPRGLRSVARNAVRWFGSRA
jgi:tetratricopeptide (TPR) repeat protein